MFHRKSVNDSSLSEIKPTIICDFNDGGLDGGAIVGEWCQEHGAQLSPLSFAQMHTATMRKHKLKRSIIYIKGKKDIGLRKRLVLQLEYSFSCLLKQLCPL